jgi:dTMP kinase
MINLKSSFYQKVQRGFLNLAKKNKSKYQIIDSNKDIEHNKSIIIRSIEKLL